MKHTGHDEIFKYDYVYQNFEDYGQVSPDEPRFKISLDIVKSITGLESIFDAGVGKGGFYNIVKHRYNAGGIEPSKTAIEKYHNNDDNIKNLFIQDIKNNYQPDSYDLVVCLDVLEHIPVKDIQVVYDNFCHIGKKYFLFSIANHEDTFFGVDLHVNLRDYRIWESELNERFNIIKTISIHDDRARLYLLEKKNNRFDHLSFDNRLLQKQELAPNDTQPLFSFIVPPYDNESSLRETLDSLLNQTFPNWEAVLVKDETVQSSIAGIMKEYAARDKRFRFINFGNHGIAAALNTGINLSTGMWICFAGSPQRYQMNFLEHINNFDSSRSKIYYSIDKSEPLNSQHPSKGFELVTLFESDYIDINNTFIHKSVFETGIKFDELLVDGCYYDLFLRLFSLYSPEYINNSSLSSSFSSNRKISAYTECEKVVSAFTHIKDLNFEGFFPSVNLFQSQNLQKAIEKFLTIALNENALLYKCGYIPVMLDKLARFICDEKYSQLKSVLLPELENIADNIRQSETIPSDIKTGFYRLLNLKFENPGDFNYNFFHESRLFLRQLVERDETAIADALKNNIMKLKGRINEFKGNSLISDYYKGKTGEETVLIISEEDHKNHFIEIIEERLAKSLPDTEFIALPDINSSHTKRLHDLNSKNPNLAIINQQEITGGKKLKDLISHYSLSQDIYWLDGGQTDQVKMEDDGFIHINRNVFPDDYAFTYSPKYSDFGYPRFLGIMPSLKCNYKCFFCRRDGNDKYGTVSLEDVKRLKTAIQRARVIDITGWGEPFTYKDIKGLIEFINENNSFDSIQVTTNGSVLTEEIARILSANLHKLVISINAATKETYERDMANGKWNKVIANLETAVKYIPGSKIFLSFVAHKGNIHEYPMLVELANRLGIRNVSLAYLQITETEYFYKSLWFCKDEANTYIEQARQLGKKYNIFVEGVKFYETSTQKKSRFTCPSPFEEAFINIDGEVGPCCFAGNVSMGNVYKNTFETVWNSPKYFRLRNEKNLPGCKRCYKSNSIDKLGSHLYNSAPVLEEIKNDGKIPFFTFVVAQDILNGDLKSTLKSIAEQTYPIWETLIVTKKADHDILNDIHSELQISNDIKFIECSTEPRISEIKEKSRGNYFVFVKSGTHLSYDFLEKEMNKILNNIPFKDLPENKDLKDIINGEVSVYSAKSVNNIVNSTLISNPEKSSPVNLSDSILPKPVFSILIPTYNQADYLPATLDSILAQTYENWEAVIVNDGSSDNTARVMEMYTAKDERFRCFHKENGGVSTALNEGLKQARGEWICWLSSDDLFVQDALETFSDSIKKFPDIKFFHSHYYNLHHERNYLDPIDPHIDTFIPKQDIQVISFLKANYVHGISIAIHRSIFEDLGNFREDFFYAQDVEMWLRISKKYPFIFINKRTCITRIHDQADTSGFPSGGDFDMGRLTLDFLNNNEFGSYFPYLDLNNPAQLSLAIQKTIEIALDLNAYMYKGVDYVPALLERFHEWLSQNCPAQIRTNILIQIRNINNQLMSLNYPISILEAFNALLSSDHDSFIYKPYNIIECMLKNMEELDKAGQMDKANLIRQYFEKYEKRNRSLLGNNKEYHKPAEYNMQKEDNGIFSGLSEKSVQSQEIYKMETLDELIKKYNLQTDKAGHYLTNYEEIFSSLRDKEINLLELGVDKGASLLLWQEYFKKGNIVGLDIKKPDIYGDRITIYEGYQQDTALLKKIKDEKASEGFDIIIDDASHVGELTKISYDFLFNNCLKDGGLYIIEDWGTGYWETWQDGKAFNPEVPHMSGMVGFIKSLIDECGIPDITFPGRGVGEFSNGKIEKLIISSGIAIVCKKAVPCNSNTPTRQETAKNVTPSITVEGKKDFKVIAIISAFNEGDVIYHVIKNLIDNGIEVYLMDNNSTDNTVEEAKKLLGKGLIHIERYPQDAGFPEELSKDFSLKYQMLRKEQLSRELKANWFINADADEFRESPFPGTTLYEGIKLVDSLGYNAINFMLLNFRPTDNSFIPGKDVRDYLVYCEPGKHYDLNQIKAWKSMGQIVNLVDTGGHLTEFAGRKVFPIPFILRHYPIRSEEHAYKKLMYERFPRFNTKEREGLWHVQYNEIIEGKESIIHSPENMMLYNRDEVCRQILEQPEFSDILKQINLNEETDNKPSVSIIIPVFNNLSYTKVCLESIYKTGSKYPFEVIIVNNNSTDGTAEFLKDAQNKYPNLKVINNNDNLRFAKACNQGADIAVGRFLVFLNNDTEVFPGWMEAAIGNFERDNNVGIVGAKLLYPDMTVQHCGIFLFRQYSEFRYWPEHRFRNKKQDDPLVNKLEEVFAVTGACLFIEKNLYNEVRGFDESYGMYFEDTDLCMKVKSKGRTIIYEPECVAIHHEGKSSPDRKTIDSLNEKAAKIFYPRWRSLLEELFIEQFSTRKEGKYYYINNEFLYPKNNLISKEDIIDYLAELSDIFSGFKPFYAHVGGIGDGLMLMATIPGSENEVSIVSVPTSDKAARSLFDSFPIVKKVYIIERPKEQIIHSALMNTFGNVNTCKGKGVTPSEANYNEWNENLDIFRQYGVQKHPGWINYINPEKIESFQVVLAPKGSVKGTFRSKRNTTNPKYWSLLLELFKANGIKPVLIGTPDEEEAYPIDYNCIDRRSYSVGSHMELIAGSDILIGADTWQKTFSGFLSIPTIVFKSMAGYDLVNFKDSSEYVFIKPWETISLVSSFKEFLDSFSPVYLSKTGKKLIIPEKIKAFNEDRLMTSKEREKLTSFSNIFWERGYTSARKVLVRCSSAVGDALMITGVISTIKKQHPHLQIYLSCENYLKDIFFGNSDIKEVVEINSNEELRIETDVDIIVAFNNIIDVLPEYHGNVHFMDILNNIAGIKSQNRDIKYFVTNEETKWAKDEIQRLNSKGKVIGIHLLTTKDIKRSYHHGYNLVLELSKVDPGMHFINFGTEKYMQNHEAIYNCSTDISLRQQIALASQCDAFITIDSAFFHIGHNLFNKPTLLIASVTNPGLIGNPAKGYAFVRNERLNCLSCYWSKQCKIECMGELHPKTITDAFFSYLNGNYPFISKEINDSIEVKIPAGVDYESFLVKNFIDSKSPARLSINDIHNILPPYAGNWNGIDILNNINNIPAGSTHNTVPYSNQISFEKADFPKNLVVEFSEEFMRLRREMENNTLVSEDRCSMIYLFAKYARSLQGDAAELGVYKGGTARIIAKVLHDRPVHLFDTFDGMPVYDSENDIHRVGDFADTSLEMVESFLSDCPNVHFYKGFFPDTATPVMDKKFAYAYSDGDQYQSTIDFLKFFYDRMVPGGIMIFDDYEWVACPGVKKALDEFFADKPEKYFKTTAYQAAVVKDPTSNGYYSSLLGKFLDSFRKSVNLYNNSIRPGNIPTVNSESNSFSAEIQDHAATPANNEYQSSQLQLSFEDSSEKDNPDNEKSSINIVWEGSQFVWHSLALINREHCSNIIDSGVADLTIIPYEQEQFMPDGNSKFEKLLRHDIRVKELSSNKDKVPYVWIRHQWPPKAEPPKGAKWIIMQPWEYSTHRKDFVEIFKQADEIWTPSNHSRQCFINSGLDFNKVQIVPNGINPQLFKPYGNKYNLPANKKVKLLFVGGTIFRKGIDILLNAYTKSFTKADNICLVVKDMGGESFYKGQTAREQIEKIKQKSNSPEIIYIDEYLNEEEMASLYRTCDVFVSPYRAEGFSLPTLEAMACGLPVVVTKGGSTDDFVDEETGWLINGVQRSIGSVMDNQPLTGEAFVIEPDENELVDILHDVYNRYSILTAVGIRASYRARTNWTWRRATLKALSRLDALYGTSLAKKADKTLPQAEDDGSLILGRAELALEKHDFDYAEELYKSAIKTESLPQKYITHALHRLTEIYLSTKDYYSVEDTLNKIEEIISLHPDTIYLRSKLNAARENWTDVLETLTPVFDNWEKWKYESTLGLTLDELLCEMAEAMFALEDAESAVTLYSQALNLNNSSSKACLGAAKCFISAGAEEEAKNMLQWAVSLNPDLSEASDLLDTLLN